MCDAAYAVRFDGKSVTGVIVFLGRAAIAWICASQKIIALSSTEGEVISVSTASKQGLHNVMLLAEIFIRTAPVWIYVDNEAAIKLTQHSTFFARSKHILVRHLHQRDLQEAEIIMLKSIAGIDNCSDLTTKVTTLPLAHHRALKSRFAHMGAI